MLDESEPKPNPSPKKSRRSKSLSVTALAKTPSCSKCGFDKFLHAHHVIAYADGGPDTLENINVLCDMCHNEWHYAEGTTSYAEFLDIPPRRVLRLIFRTPSADTMTIAEIKDVWIQARIALRQLGVTRDWEIEEQNALLAELRAPADPTYH